MLDDHLLTDIVIIGISCAVKDNNIFRMMGIFFFQYTRNYNLINFLSTLINLFLLFIEKKGE